MPGCKGPSQVLGIAQQKQDKKSRQARPGGSCCGVCLILTCPGRLPHLRCPTSSLCLIVQVHGANDVGASWSVSVDWTRSWRSSMVPPHDDSCCWWGSSKRKAQPTSLLQALWTVLSVCEATLGLNPSKRSLVVISSVCGLVHLPGPPVWTLAASANVLAQFGLQVPLFLFCS